MPYSYRQTVQNAKIDNDILTIYTSKYCGLCNRLKHIVSSMRFFNNEFSKIVIYFPIKNSTWFNCSFTDLFSIEGYEVESIDENIDKFNYSDNYKFYLKDSEQKEIYIPYFQLFKPSEKVKSIIESIKLPDDYIGIHIRHDKIWRRMGRSNPNDINLFMKKIDNFPNNKFYLSCMSPEINQEISDKYGKSIYKLHNGRLSTNNLLDVADLICLSKSKHLIGTHGSTFSECSYYLSGGKQTIEYVGHWTL